MALLNVKDRYLSWYEAQQDITEWASKAFPERSFETVQRKLCMQEMSELTLAIGKGDIEKIKDETADCMILLLDMCTILDVDISHEIKKKMEINKQRKWKVDQYGVSQHV